MDAVTNSLCNNQEMQEAQWEWHLGDDLQDKRDFLKLKSVKQRSKQRATV